MRFPAAFAAFAFSALHRGPLLVDGQAAAAAEVLGGALEAPSDWPEENSEAVNNVIVIMQSNPTGRPTTYSPTTYSPTTYSPTTYSPTTYFPTTYSPITYFPTTYSPNTYSPSTYSPTTYSPTTYSPTTYSPTTYSPTLDLSTDKGSPVPTTVPSPIASPPPEQEATLKPTRVPTHEPTRHVTHEPSLSNSQTIQPSERCIDVAVDLDDELIGSGTYCDTVFFRYEIETHSNILNTTIDDEIIPAIENAVLESLLPMVVGECGSDESVRARFRSLLQQQQGRSPERRRRATIFGMSTYPKDVHHPSSSPLGRCRSTETSSNHTCSAVQGATLICATDYATDAESILAIIEEGMVTDSYVDTNKDIIKVYFISGEDGSNDDHSGIEGDNSSSIASTNAAGLSPTNVWAIIGGSVASIVAIVALGQSLCDDDQGERAVMKHCQTSSGEA